jgi:hypothetical protein
VKRFTAKMSKLEGAESQAIVEEFDKEQELEASWRLWVYSGLGEWFKSGTGTVQACGS